MSVTTVSTVMQEAVNNVPRNDIINGGLVVNQENQTAPADAAYTIGDLFLHNGEGTPVMSLETDGPQGTRPWQQMVLDANDQGGLAYIVPNDTVQDYIANGKLSFGIQLKTTAATISNARIGILKWTGTADAVTKELVGTWASDGTNPTLATSLSYENTPANIGLTTSWARHTVEDVTVDSDTTNIIVFVWTDDGTITASDVIGFSEWQLNPGSTVNDFSSPGVERVLFDVEYYLHRLQLDKVSDERIAFGGVTSTAQIEAIYHYPRKLRAIPVITQSAFATFTGRDSAATAACDSMTHNSIAKDTVNLLFHQAGTSWTVGQAAHGRRATTATAFIQFDARIGV